MREPFTNTRGFLCCVVIIGALVSAGVARAQDHGSRVPYASIGSKGVSYAGPGREASYDLVGSTIRIGVIAPMHGPQKADGESIVRAAQMALDDESKQPLPGSLRLTLAVGDESGPAWGRVTDAVLHLVFDDHAVALITSANGATAHLSEQVANKIGIPVLTLSTDSTTTQLNLPWIFRLGPSDTQQAVAMARDIYHVRGFRHVLLVTERDHDGRTGGHEFIEAARRLGVPDPASLIINPLQPDTVSLLNVVRTQPPQAILLWTTPENARKLLESIRRIGAHIPVCLPQEAAQEGSGLKFNREDSDGGENASGMGIYTVAGVTDGASAYECFAQRYQAETGALPGPVAAEAYDAVRLIARAVRTAGPNRARVRDCLSSVRDFPGTSGVIRFDGEGNNTTATRLVRLY
ncbi:MAG TPA: ABC transporter substrate-binding protein [Terriglobia bacterium]|nr:ABC transporter substrate-binding protein [Terriglobia bacterium]